MVFFFFFFAVGQSHQLAILVDSRGQKTRAIKNAEYFFRQGAFIVRTSNINYKQTGRALRGFVLPLFNVRELQYQVCHAVGLPFILVF